MDGGWVKLNLGLALDELGNMKHFLVIVVIIIINMFLKYVLGFINNIIIILVINTISGHVFLKECKKTQYFGFSGKRQYFGFFQKKPKYWPFLHSLRKT